MEYYWDSAVQEKVREERRNSVTPRRQSWWAENALVTNEAPEDSSLASLEEAVDSSTPAEDEVKKEEVKEEEVAVPEKPEKPERPAKPAKGGRLKRQDEEKHWGLGTDNLNIELAELDDLLPCRVVYVRRQRAVITEVERPLVHFQIMGSGTVHHRNFKYDSRMFRIEVDNKGEKKFIVGNHTTLARLLSFPAPVVLSFFLLWLAS